MERDFFDTVAGVLQGDIFDPYLFIICLDSVLRMSMDLMKENGFTLKIFLKSKKQTIPRTNYYGRRLRNDIALPANTSTQAESLLHSLKQAAICTGLHINAHKMEYICVNPKRRHLHTKWWLSEIGG